MRAFFRERSLIAATVLLAASSVVKAGGYQAGPVDCGGFPRVPVETREGLCLGLVVQASEQIPLVKPRTAIQVHGREVALIADMGGWSEGKGKLWLIDYSKSPPVANGLLSGLNLPHTVAYGPRDSMFLGTAEQILRFSLDGGALVNLETVIENLPYDAGYLHPLKHFVFDRDGSLIVNIGSRTDRCEKTTAKNDCVSDGEASLRRYAYDRETDSWDAQYEILARGLRNSMALAVHPSGTILQAENSVDLRSADEPYEELNVIVPGAFYGWPYCVNRQSGLIPMESACKRDDYQQPWTLLPPHVAPLDALYYEGTRLASLRGRLLMSWHGYRVVGHRIVAYEVDAEGKPIRGSDAVYVSDPLPGEGDFSQHAFRADGGTGSVAQHVEVVSGWNEVPGVRPEGAPVGLSVDDEGAIWIVDDKNKAILRLSVGEAYKSRSPPDTHDAMTLPSKVKNLFTTYCANCHVELTKRPASLLNEQQWLRSVDGVTLIEHKLLRDTIRPMPPDGEMDAANRRELVGWVRNYLDQDDGD